MIILERNPEGVRSDYLRCLNQCFEHWGDDDDYDWCFTREVGSQPADLFVMRLNGELVAGSAVSYRKAQLGNGAEIDVGIMTGSWTLPAARGQGCFTRAVHESVELAASRGAALLLAFVTEINASSRRLAAAGSALFPTRYAFTTPDTPPAAQNGPTITPVADAEAALTRMRRYLEGVRDGRFHLRFPRSEDWRTQFLERPGDIRLVALGEQGYCVLEAAADTDRVQLLALGPDADLRACLTSLLRRAQAKGRKLFLFSTDPRMWEQCDMLQMGGISGYLTALVADADALGRVLGTSTAWSNATSEPLADPDSEWYLGACAIQSGERA